MHFGGAMVSTAASQQEGSCLECPFQLKPFVCACVDHLQLFSKYSGFFPTFILA